jgi:hypothetical protein
LVPSGASAGEELKATASQSGKRITDRHARVQFHVPQAA